MSKFQIVIEFTHEENREDFLGWLSDGGGEYMFMEGQHQEDITHLIEQFDYSDAFEAWGHDGTEPKVVKCLTGDEIE